MQPSIYDLTFSANKTGIAVTLALWNVHTSFSSLNNFLELASTRINGKKTTKLQFITPEVAT